MPENVSLLMLAEDLKHVALQLEAAVKEKRWPEALQKARAVLGTASRTFARLDGINAALAELEQG